MNMVRLNQESCAVFEQAFFQFAQMKKYCPERIDGVKQQYRQHWLVWQEMIRGVAQDLGEPFAAPHIERWCNGWQVRAHFFAFFKYAQYQQSAAILSVVLNRLGLTVSLDWHAYKGHLSPISLTQYHQWLLALSGDDYADFLLWRGSDDEYAPHLTVAQWRADGMSLREGDFWRIGKQLTAQQLAECDVQDWVAKSIRLLLPLYEQCFE